MTRGERIAGCVLALVVAVSVAGCAPLSMGRDKRGEALTASVTTYRKLIRWSYYDEAAKYLRGPDGKPIAADLAQAAHYRVTGYTISNQIMSDDAKEARVIAIIQFYELDAGVIHSVHDAQQWWYEEKEKRWYLKSSLPDFAHPDAVTSDISGR